jgi:hypothetical protein
MYIVHFHRNGFMLNKYKNTRVHIIETFETVLPIKK